MSRAIARRGNPAAFIFQNHHALSAAIAGGAVGGGLLVDRLGALGGPGFADVALTLGTLLTLRHGPRAAPRDAA